MSGPLPNTVVWSCPEDGCTYRINRAGDAPDATAWDARVLPRMRERHYADRHGEPPETVVPTY